MLILAGMAIYGYLASSIVELIAHGVLTGAMAERRRRRMIERISDHYIICGYGRVGRQVADEFRDAASRSSSSTSTRRCSRSRASTNVPYIDGSGTKDEDLEAAGLERARGLVASSDSDVDNLYIAVSARSERPDMHDRRAGLDRGRGARRCSAPAPTASCSRTPRPARRSRS